LPIFGGRVIGSRGAAALLAAAAVTALLTGCEPLTTGAAGSVPTSEASSPAPATKQTPKATATRATKARSSTTPTAKPRPSQPKALLEQGDRGEKVRELQHRLRQLEWYFGSITGSYGRSTTKAVRGFQQKRKITVSGKVDRRTWTVLVAMTRTPTRAERHNVLVPGPALLERGSNGRRVRDLQARLKQIGWFSVPVTGTYGGTTAASVRGFQRKRQIPVTGEVDQRTLDRLRAMTRTPSNAELYNRVPTGSASGLDRRCLTGRALCISKRTNSLVWVVDGQARLRMDVRFGSIRTPTREGWFSVGWKSRHHFSSLYDTAMPYAMFFSGGQAVHYSPDFAARGYNGASHGCVNVRNLPGIQALYAQVRVGDKVIVYR
jgi:peptidoglycan hydrolase-like protein with peptidoglycan-binding domain